MADYSSFFNEAGEPLMSGEQMRQEMWSDAYYSEPDPDAFYDAYYEGEDDEPFCKRCGEYGHESDECEEDMSWAEDYLYTEQD